MCWCGFCNFVVTFNRRHAENPGNIIYENDNVYKFFYGMSSSYAMENNYSVYNNSYRSSDRKKLKLNIKVHYKKQ